MTSPINYQFLFVALHIYASGLFPFLNNLISPSFLPYIVTNLSTPGNLFISSSDIPPSYFALES